jgi:hypothetical protein
MTKFTNCRFSGPGPDGTPTHITCLADGVAMSVPFDLANKEWAEIVEQGLTIADYVPPAPTWAGIRGERDALLKSTDWWGVSDRTMSAEETAYRQSLRDLPQTFASPADVVWPTKPA